MTSAQPPQKILIVDDSPVVSRGLHYFFANKGVAEIQTAENGLVALEILQTFHPEVIILDLLMPKISGEQLCRLLRGKKEYDQTCIIILSGIAVENTTDFRALGANACIAKGPIAKTFAIMWEFLRQAGQDGPPVCEETLGEEDIYSRQATTELLRIKNHYERIWEHISDGVFELAVGTDPLNHRHTYTIVSLSPITCQLLGKAENDLLGSNLLSHFDPATQANFLAALEPPAPSDTTPATANSTNFVCRYNDRGLEVKIVAVKDDQEAFFIVVFTDITARLAAENRVMVTQSVLSQREAEYHAVVEAQSEMLIRFNLDGTLTFVNGAFCRFLRKRPEELLGLDILAILRPENLPWARQCLTTLGEGHKMIRENIVMQGADGVRCWFRWTATLVSDPNGQPVSVQAVGLDINDLVTMQEGLSLFRELLDRVEDGIFVANPVSGAFLDVNEKECRALGYGREQLLGMQCHEVDGNTPDKAAWDAKVAKMRASGSTRMEGSNIRADGTSFPVEIFASFVRLPQGNEYLVGVVRDISERQQKDQLLREALETANSANLAKSYFLANMSHEIRTPLNAIIGMAELLKETPVSDEQREYINIFETNGEALLTIINDIIDLSKVEAGRIELECREFDPVQLVEEACALLALKAHEKGLELHHDLGLDLPPCLEGDPSRLRQVLINLIGNAVKFTAEGEVVVRCTVQEEAGLAAGETELLFAVSDTGIGIPIEKQQVIFERFSQADTTTTRQFGGTGLGLTISRQLVTLMGGALWIESREGHGSTFYFTTRLRVKAPPRGAAAGPFLPMRGQRVLVIDDNPTNRMILYKMLEGWRMRVRAVENGQQGLDAMREAAAAGAPYDLVLLDYRMPGMDGFQVARQIKGDPTLNNSVVFMLSSDERRFLPERYAAAGIRAALVKPVRREELLLALGRLGAGSGPIAPSPAGQRQGPLPDSWLQGPRRVLLADDYHHNRIIVQQYLKDTPFQLDMAEDGAAAVAKFKAGLYDLVLMDLQMPVLDGFNATRAIRSFEREQGRSPVPIIALSAYAMPQELQRSREAGCVEHLTKPVKKAELLTSLYRHLTARPPVDAAPPPPSSLSPRQEGAATPSAAGEAVVAGGQQRLPVRLERDFAPFIPEFLQAVAANTNTMREALLANDYAFIHATGHRIKGAGGGYGLDGISEIAHRVEEAAREKDAATIGKQLDRLADYLRQIDITFA